ncbi:MAG TPA: DoxX family protein [Vicinamibacteria bacterium]|nr:DoxX family protein [Vicinamibacteria bacterium]
MIVPIVLGLVLLLARLAGAAGVEALDSWPAATRAGLAGMLLFTAIAHFNSMRHDLARMVPPAIPHPMAMIYFTGVCEALGAVGLLVPRTRVAAAAALILLFVALLPANVHAARAGVTLRGRPATPLALRVPLQILFIALTAWAGVFASR